MVNRSDQDWNKPSTLNIWYVSKLLVFLTVLLITLSSCSTSTNREETPPPNEIDTSGLLVLNSTICELPCWEGITPGATSKQDAINIFNNLKTDKDEVVIDEVVESSEAYVYLYVGVTGEMLADIMQTITLSIRDGIVQVVSVRSINMTLVQVIDVLGMPEGVMRLPGEIGGGTLIVYPKKGIMLGLLVPKNNIFGPRPKLEPESIISSATIYPAGTWDETVGEHWILEEWAKKHTHPWNGYGYIDKKYPIYEGE